MDRPIVVGHYDQELVDADNRSRFTQLQLELAAVKAERRAWRIRAEQAERMLQIHRIAYAPPASAVDKTGGKP